MRVLILFQWLLDAKISVCLLLTYIQYVQYDRVLLVRAFVPHDTYYCASVI